jgi:hypothetical protein
MGDQHGNIVTYMNATARYSEDFKVVEVAPAILPRKKQRKIYTPMR